MKKSQIFFIMLVAIAVFLLVYSPHFNYPFPFHIDEWHHITEAIKLKNGEYSGGGIGYRVGFQFILYSISILIGIGNLIAIYQYFPAIWAVVSALVLFYVVYRKTDKNFLIALFSMLFFASLKSNVNIEGLWFFTPLSFSLPFIFLYVYFFTEGIEKRNKKQILISLIIMAFLIPIHSISVLFAVPFLFVYSMFYHKYLWKEWKFFSLFLIIPIIGIIIYTYFTKLSLLSSLVNLFFDLQFKRGWGVLEANNSFLETYGIIGYLFAIIGVFSIFIYQKEHKKYLAYLLWFALTLISIIIYRFFGVSYLAPYQRTFYYFAISLPFLSSLGLYYLFKLKNDYVDRSGIIDKHYAKKFISLVLVLIVLFFTFYSYYSMPKDTGLYKLIDNNDYNALLFLKEQPAGKVMAPPEVSSALYAISGKSPVGAIYFYGNRTESENFFKTNDCSEKNKILKRNRVSYVLSKFPINCTYPVIYDLRDLVYDVHNISNPQKEQAIINSTIKK